MRTRPVGELDVPALVALINEATPAFPIDEAELRLSLRSPTGDVEFTLLEDEAGEPIGYADVFGAETAPDRASLDIRIPSRTASGETIAALVDWGEATATAQGRTLVRAAVVPGEPLEAALCARGYRPIRHFFRMRIDLDAHPPEPAWPDGIEVRTFEAGDERAVYAADAEAFSDHWDFTGFPYEEFEHFFLHAADFDPSLWLIARDGDDVAGVSICRPCAPGRPGVGWVRSLAVRRPWRRRGLGLALLLASFGSFWERGTRTVGLGVDGENTTGAVRLYEKAGMRVEHRFDTYERELS